MYIFNLTFCKWHFAFACFVHSLRSLIIKNGNGCAQVGRFYSCFLCPPLKYTLFLRGKSNKICKEMWKKEKFMQSTGYMLFKLKDFFIGEEMNDERANDRVEKRERERESYII